MPEAPDKESGPSFGENVTVLEHEGKQLFLVGTAHVSRKSVEEVTRLVAELEPDAVCVELDRDRYETLADESRWRLLDVVDVVRRGRSGLFLASLVFAGFQKRLGDALGVKPGAEMLAATEAARRAGAELVFADRNIQSTLQRCYQSLGPLDRAKVVVVLAMLPFAAGDIDEAEVEKLKSRETMGDAMESFARHMPALKVPLIDERDRYLIEKTRTAPGRRVVSVVGAAHVPGMVRAATEAIDCEALSTMARPNARAALLGFALPAATLAALAFSGALSGVPGVLRAATGIAVGAALGPLLLLLLVGASVPTLAAGVLLGPVSTLLPGDHYGKLAALTEARLHPPTPDDAARLRDDVLSPSQARKNAALRPVLIALAAPLGRALGAFPAIAWLTLSAVVSLVAARW